MKQKLLLLFAVFLGIMAFLLSYSHLQAEKRKIMGSAEEVILIKTTRAMASGEVIREQDITRDRVKRLRDENRSAYGDIPWSSASRVVGRRLDIGKESGERLQWSDLKQTYSRASGLTGVIRKDYRAISIPVDTISSVTNLIKPGDNVDVIGTFRFPETRGDSSMDTLTLTILQNVKVLATGPRWNPSAAPEDMSRGYSTVTLELTPKEVEMIIFASQKGKLTLSLRNFEESSFTRDLQSVNFKYLEQKIPSYNAERENRQRIQ